ncbi:MAG: DUF1801 domain-containing protein [Myxococcales bacterium]|nr:DUF1801 domain-containing protein [Myxococcales bacterium]
MAAKKSSTKKTTTKKPAAPAKKAAKPAPRADFGAPIDGFFAKQPAHLREILEALRGLVEAAAPAATASLKWGMPFYELDGKMMCALGAHKAHVNLILSGPAAAYEDDDGLLIGESQLGRHLKLTAIEQLPRAKVKAWLATAVKLARAG